MQNDDFYQPDFYHFNQDSIELVNFIIRNSFAGNIKRIIDLCAGCGVIGIELARKVNSVTHIDFVEVQREYNPFIKKNMQEFLPHMRYEIHNQKISEFIFEKQTTDLLVANPPYFLKGKGRESKDRQRQIARCFEIDSIEVFIQKVKELNCLNIFVYPSDQLDLESLKEVKLLERQGRIGFYSVI